MQVPNYLWPNEGQCSARDNRKCRLSRQRDDVKARIGRFAEKIPKFRLQPCSHGNLFFGCAVFVAARTPRHLHYSRQSRFMPTMPNTWQTLQAESIRIIRAHDGRAKKEAETRRFGSRRCDCGEDHHESVPFLLVVGCTDDSDDPVGARRNASHAFSTHRSSPSLTRPCSAA